MIGKYIYVCKTDLTGSDKGKYIQPTRRVWPTHELAACAAAGVAPSRHAIVVELPAAAWVEVDARYYPDWCDGCVYRLRPDGGYCYMFEEQPETVPCAEFDRMKPIKDLARMPDEY